MKIQVEVHWPRRRWLLLAGLLAVLAVGVPVALAMHDYTDVPDASPFHGDIAAVKRAGITSGKTCVPPGTPPTYCPSEPITREAMAAFVHRGFGRIGYGQNGGLGLTTSYADVTTVTLSTGGVAGGTGFVKLDAAIGAYITSNTGCPCMAGFNITQDGGGNSFFHYVTAQNLTSGGSFGGFHIETGSLEWVVPVATATTYTFRLKGAVQGGTGSMTGFGELTAEYYPFGSTGTDVLGATPSAATAPGSPIAP